MASAKKIDKTKTTYEAPLCDPGVLKDNHVFLVEKVNVDNILPSLRPFLLYTELDVIKSERSEVTRVRALIDCLQRRSSVGSYVAFDAFMKSLAGTQPEVFRTLCGRHPTRTEADFCVEDVVENVKAQMNMTGHYPDSALDESIDFDSQFVHLSIIEVESEQSHGIWSGSDPEIKAPLHTITACDISVSDCGTKKKVLLFGKAGSGKSTTCQWLAKQWAVGKWASGFTVLFLLQTRNLLTSDHSVTTIELLALCSLYSIDAIVESTPFPCWLRHAACRVLIFLDGLDNIPDFVKRMRNSPIITDINQKAHPIDLCINLLRGNLLPGSTVISMSRPFLGLKELSFDAKFEFLGLTQTNVTEFVQFSYPSRAAYIMSVLKSRPLLMSACTSLYILMLITRLLWYGVEILGEDIGTYTRLMAFLFVQSASRRSLDTSFLIQFRPILPKLAHMAYKGIFTNDGLARSVFNEFDLADSDMNASDLEALSKCGILQVRQHARKMRTSIVAEFSHFSFQELLASAHELSQLSPSSADKLNDLYSEGRWSNILTYMLGLYFDTKNSWVQDIRYAVGSKLPSSDPLKKQLERQFSDFIDSHASDSQRDLMKVCHLVREAQWEEKAKEIGLHQVPDGCLEITDVALSHTDLMAIDFICRSPLQSIIMRDIQADDSFVDILVPLLLTPNMDTIQVLDLSRNNICDSGAITIAYYLCDPDSKQTLPVLQELELTGNKIGQRGMQALGAILRSNRSLQHLGVSDNEIGEEGVVALANGLEGNTTLEALWLSYLPEDGYGMTALASALSMNTNLTTLSMPMSDIGDDAVMRLVSGLNSNTTLRYLGLSYNHIRNEGLVYIAQMLCENTGLHSLDLSYNSIEGSGTQALVECLSSNASLKDLNISHNKIDDSGAMAMAAILEINTSLLTLNVSYNEIADAGAEAITGAIQRNTSLRTLDMSHNKIGDVGAMVMAENLIGSQYLTFLNIRNRCIGSTGRSALANLRKSNSKLVLFT